MSVAQVDWAGIGGTRIVVGLSQVIRVVPPSNSWGGQLKIAAGGGTLEIVTPQYSGSSTASGATAWAQGYLVGSSEIVQLQGAAVYYLAATGATMTVSAFFGLTPGATLL